MEEVAITQARVVHSSRCVVLVDDRTKIPRTDLHPIVGD